MRATAPTNVSPAWRAPTWVAAKGQKPSFYLKQSERLECEVDQPFVQIPGDRLETVSFH